MSYVPLHVHTCLDSIRDSCLKIDEYVSKAIELKLPAIAVTGHGSMASHYKFYKECKKQNIKPILGLETYFAIDAQNKGNNYHLLLLAKNNIGWQNLCKLSTWSYTSGFYRKPRIDLNILNQYKEGLICSTACAFSYPAQLIVNNELDLANEHINTLHKMFKDDFYLEIMEHGFEDEVIVKNYYRNYGQENKIKVICTSDIHFLEKTDKEFHGIFKNISYSSGGDKDSSFGGDGYHLHTFEEMKDKFLISELNNTLEIADKCDISFKFTNYKIPKFDIPEKNLDKFEYLSKLCMDGLKRLGKQDDKAYIDRLNLELNEVHLSDLEDYILVVADYCNWCKKNNIAVGPGRGSVGNSIVAILTGISEVDSVKYNLVYSRFLNSGRVLKFDFGV